jgi:holo-[acyl-carrier protein] synthase
VIVGIGVDIVAVNRFVAVLAKTPRMQARLFTEREQLRPDGTALGPDSLAARFAAKEAVAKALGAPLGMAWHDCEVVAGRAGQPVLELRASVAAAAADIGARAWSLSLSHDGGLAIAYVVAEGG